MLSNYSNVLSVGQNSSQLKDGVRRRTLQQINALF